MVYNKIAGDDIRIHGISPLLVGRLRGKYSLFEVLLELIGQFQFMSKIAQKHIFLDVPSLKILHTSAFAIINIVTARR